MAAQHFMELGFQHFAFCGFKGLIWSDQRWNSYRDYLTERGYTSLFNYDEPPKQSPKKQTERQDIARWLKSLPKPICVFACNDDRGVYVQDACKIAGLNVPEEVAVLGVDNDELLCDLSSPPLSSIELNFERAGFSAAKLLDEMMTGQSRTSHIVVEPVHIVTRQSTDVFAVDDEQVVRSLIFIRGNYTKPIQVKDVVGATVLSRRELELRFKNKLNRSIKDEINRLRIESVKHQLVNSNETIYSIANSLSYTDAQHFGRFFRQEAGQSPSEFRQSHKPFE